MSTPTIEELRRALERVRDVLGHPSHDWVLRQSADGRFWNACLGTLTFWDRCPRATVVGVLRQQAVVAAAWARSTPGCLDVRNAIVDALAEAYALATNEGWWGDYGSTNEGNNHG